MVDLYDLPGCETAMDICNDTWWCDGGWFYSVATIKQIGGCNWRLERYDLENFSGMISDNCSTFLMLNYI